MSISSTLVPVFFPFANESQKKLFPDVVKHMLLKNIHIHSLNLLNFVCIVAFDVEAALENVKLAILERLVLQMSFSTSQTWCKADQEIPLKKFCLLMTHLPSFLSG